MHRFNGVLSDILSQEFELLFANTLLRTSVMSRNSLSDCQSVKRMYCVKGQCLDSTWDFYCDWHWTYYETRNTL